MNNFILRYIPIVVGAMAAAIAVMGTAIGVLWYDSGDQRTQLSEAYESRLEEVRSYYEGRISQLTVTVNDQTARLQVASAKIQDLEDAVLQYEKEKTSMHARFLAFTTSHDFSPFPMWIKDRNGKVLTCNKAYEREFLLPRGLTMNDYIDHFDQDVWPDHVAEEFRQNDLSVLQFGNILDTSETVPASDGSDDKRQVRIVKWPTYAPGIDRPFGVSGIAIVDELN